KPPISPRQKHAEIRAGRADPLRRIDEDRLRHIQRAQQTDAALREKIAQLQHGKSAAERKFDVLTTERAKLCAIGSRPSSRTTDGT
ncbi:MAG TPA: hypothetical protein VJ255_03225, partial [Candidatus Acidoferrum sp.]|nr:hypothetical protein [Candidatus Acidoferrum sp.]